MTKEAKPDAGSPTVEMTEEEIVRDVWMQFEIDRFMCIQNFFETIYPTIPDEAKHFFKERYEKHRDT